MNEDFFNCVGRRFVIFNCSKDNRNHNEPGLAPPAEWDSLVRLFFIASEYEAIYILDCSSFS